ncbi:phosphoenolpyruvate-utilizing N-terminal domain-containing protein, partial [Shewanella frigidimarina]|uniref:phosphoenolpyruvate-utilizing N-terminal domain-containing protein n=1 Tax=Shewanella frigidimarina TaxID=56812 RepID=UPI003F9FBD45
MSITGIAVSSGIAFGQALHLNLHHEKVDYRLIPKSQVPIEIHRLKHAFDLQKQHLTQGLE